MILNKGIAFLLILIFIMTGCSSIQKYDAKSVGLQNALKNGSIVLIGEEVRVATIDGAQYEFTVTKVDENKIYGAKNEILISEITAIETEEFSWVRTTALVIAVSFTLVSFLLIRAITDLFSPTGISAI